MAKLGRLLTAMVTPFTEDGDVDYARAGELATALIRSGSDGLGIGGTTGEAPAMNDEELIRLFAAVKEAIGEDGAVVAGTTNNNTRGSIALSREAERWESTRYCSQFQRITSQQWVVCINISPPLQMLFRCQVFCITSPLVRH